MQKKKDKILSPLQNKLKTLTIAKEERLNPLEFKLIDSRIKLEMFQGLKKEYQLLMQNITNIPLLRIETKNLEKKLKELQNQIN